MAGGSGVPAANGVPDLGGIEGPDRVVRRAGTFARGADGAADAGRACSADAVQCSVEYCCGRFASSI